MVATALNRPPTSGPEQADGAAGSNMREQVARALDPALQRLKNRWVILLLFTLVYAVFGYQYWITHTERLDLQSEINALKAQLSVDPSITEGLESDFALYTAAIASAREQQVVVLKDSGIVEKLLTVASDTGAEITSAGVSENSVAPLGDDIYEVTPVLMQVEGSLDALEAFIAQLEGRVISTMEVQNSTISNTEEGYMATVRTIIYNRPVSPDSLPEDEEETPTGRVTGDELDRIAGGGK